MLGNLTGSVFGFARQAVIAQVFGNNLQTDAFFAASIVPQMFYDLVIGAAVSAALIPTFTEILDIRGREALWRTVGSILTLVWLILLCLIVLLVAGARPLMSLLLAGYHQHLASSGIDVAVSIVRILIPALFFLGTSAVLTATLYSLGRFSVPVFAASLYHIGIIAGAVLIARPLGINALAIGAVAGAASQTVAQALAVLRRKPELRFRLELTPDVRRILRLYAPVAAGLLISIVGQVIDIGFKWSLGPSAVTSMQFATTLTQFPIGIAVAAMSFAILPSISSDAAFNRMGDYKDTLATGIRLVMFLTIPAAVGYLALGTPIISLLFQHGKFTHVDSLRTAAALSGYAIQIPFVGLDQMLVFSFYARKDTITPMLVGVAGVGLYVASALVLKDRYHVLGLALSNTIQNSAHAVVLLAIMFATVGTLSRRGVTWSVLRSLVSACIMGAGAGGLAFAIREWVNTDVFAGKALEAVVPLTAALLLYVTAAAVLRSQELTLVWDIARRRLS